MSHLKNLLYSDFDKFSLLELADMWQLMRPPFASLEVFGDAADYSICPIVARNASYRSNKLG